MLLSDWLNVLAIPLSPLIALQVSKNLDERKERRQRKMWVFYTPMATRNARVHAEHVRALNSIDIEFTKEKAITLAWKAYLDHLNDTSQDISVWAPRSDDLLVELLHAMSTALNFDFDKTHLKRAIYSPRAHGEADEDARVIRKALVAIAKGEQGLRVDLPEITESEAEEAAAQAVKKAFRDVLTGEKPIRVTVENARNESGPRSGQSADPS
jgi:hypothetical protein